MLTDPTQPDLVIARVDPARLKAHIWKPILRGVVNLLIVPLAIWGGHRLGTQMSGVSPAARSGGIHIPLAVYAVCGIPTVWLCGVMLLEARRQWKEKQMVIHDGCVTFTTDSGYLSRFELANIAELHLRKKGSPKKTGKDAGVGLRLIEPRFVTPRGRTSRVLPMIGGLFSKSHLFFPCVYDASDAEIAARLQQAILDRTGRRVPVCVVAGNRYVGGPPAAVPMAQDVGVICCECGYDLRGLTSTAVCPECGTPVGRSEGGLRLANANPVWVARLRRGATFLALAGLAATICGTALGRILLAEIQGGDAGSGWGAVSVLGGMLALGLFPFGAWWLTRPNSRRVAAGDPISRQIAQGLVCLPLAVIPLCVIRWLHLLEAMALIALSFCVSGIFILWYSREIWRLVPNRRWRTVAAVLAIVCAVLMLPAEIGFAGGVVARRIAGPAAMPPPAASGPAVATTQESPFDDPSVSPQARRVYRAVFTVVFMTLAAGPPLLFFLAMGWLRWSMPRLQDASMPPMARPAGDCAAPMARPVGGSVPSTPVGPTDTRS